MHNYINHRMHIFSKIMHAAFTLNIGLSHKYEQNNSDDMSLRYATKLPVVITGDHEVYERKRCDCQK